MKKKIVYVDMDGVLCDFAEAHATALASNPGIQYPQSQYGFFRNLKPLTGALAAMASMRSNPELDVYILTAPSVHNPLCYSEKREWVETHLGMGMVHKLIISPNKGLNKGDFLIDDHKEGRGQDEFTRSHCLPISWQPSSTRDSGIKERTGSTIYSGRSKN